PPAMRPDKHIAIHPARPRVGPSQQRLRRHRQLRTTPLADPQFPLRQLARNQPRGFRTLPLIDRLRLVRRVPLPHDRHHARDYAKDETRGHGNSSSKLVSITTTYYRRFVSRVESPDVRFRRLEMGGLKWGS